MSSKFSGVTENFTMQLSLILLVIIEEEIQLYIEAGYDTLNSDCRNIFCLHYDMFLLGCLLLTWFSFCFRYHVTQSLDFPSRSFLQSRASNLNQPRAAPACQPSHFLKNFNHIILATTKSSNLQQAYCGSIISLIQQIYVSI